MIHSDFEQAFRPGVKFIAAHSGDFYQSGDPVLAGWFETANGRLVVCDPYDLARFEFGPLVRSFAPGKYSVYLATSLWCSGSGTGNQHHVSTAAKLVVSSAPVVTWELAKRVTSDQDDPLLQSFADGFQLARGFCCFAAADQVMGQNRLPFINAFGRWHEQVFKHGWWGGEFNDPQHPGNNAVACIAADHDGMAYGFWGLDARGDIAQLAIDFCILIEPVYESINVPLAELAGGKTSTFTLAGQPLTVSLVAANDPQRISLEVRGDLQNLSSLEKSIVFPDGEVKSCGHIAETSQSDDCHLETMTLDAATLRAGQVRLSAAVGMQRKLAVKK